MNQTDKSAPIRYCLYARKSSEAEDRQAMSIEAQLKEMHEIAKRENLNIVQVRQESKSAKAVGVREQFNQMLLEVQNGDYNGILTWAPDRLSRNAGDLGKLVDMMDEGRLSHIRTHGQTFTNNPNEKFLLMILCSQAKLENDNRSKNIRRGLKAKCERGMRPGQVPLGYVILRDASKFRGESKVVIDTERAQFIRKMFEYVVHDNLSGRKVHEYLQQEGFTTRSGKKLTPSMTFRIFKETFYYGEFEYPRGSGNWYKGIHEPLITKEMFHIAQRKLKTHQKSKWGSKMFFYNRIFKCGECGSGVCGEERTNRHGKQYIYYRCNKYSHNQGNCSQKYIRKEKLEDAVVQMIAEKSMFHEKIHRKIERDVERFNKIQQSLTGETSKQITSEEYIRYVFQNGTSREKSTLLECIQGQLKFANQRVWVDAA